MVECVSQISCVGILIPKFMSTGFCKGAFWGGVVWAIKAMSYCRMAFLDVNSVTPYDVYCHVVMQHEGFISSD